MSMPSSPGPEGAKPSTRMRRADIKRQLLTQAMSC
jgi:hypothetical protein